MERASQYRCIQRVIVSTQTTTEKILENARKNPAAWDGICISTFANISEPAQDAETRFCRIRDSMRILQAEGHMVQLGMSFTLGHGDSPLYPEVTVPPMVGPNGERCHQSLCPRSEEAVQEFRKLFRRYASLKPECIWLDDDFRMYSHAPAACGCFCDACMDRFNRHYGHSYTRETLVDELLEDHFPQENPIRLEWMAFNHKALLTLAGEMAQAVHQVDPHVIMGLMTAGAQFNIYDQPDYRDFLPVLANQNGEVWFRPGAFFYEDSVPFEAVRKAFALSVTNQHSAAPHVRTYSEIVMCPYVKRGKALKIVRFEALAHIGLGGVNGITFESIKEMIDEMDAYLGMIQENAPYLQALADAVADRTQIGLYPWFSAKEWAYADAGNSMDDLHRDSSGLAVELLRIGVPLTANPEGALGVILAGNNVKAMPKDQLKAWLRKGVYADGEAAEWVNRMLGGTPMGVVISGPASSTCEKFSDHELNGEHTGFLRCPFAGGLGTGARAMHLAGATALSEAVNGAIGSAEYQKPVGSVGCAVYETPEGGRTAVMAVAPWALDIVSFAKSDQILNVLDWLSRGLPVRIFSDCRVGQSVWRGEKDMILFLMNMDFDPAKNVRLQFASPMRLERLEANGVWREVGSGSEYSIPELGDFDCAVFRMTPMTHETA